MCHVCLQDNQNRKMAWIKAMDPGKLLENFSGDFQEKTYFKTPCKKIRVKSRTILCNLF